jgi:hypothetical protein
MGTVITGNPLERIAIDIMGPLPETESGNKYIMVVGDYFTKWTEAYAIPDHTAETVALYLVTEFICRLGIPHQIHTDQGREFQGFLFLEMCELLDVIKTRTSPWRPQSDGMIERFNRTLATMLRQVVDQSQKDWDTYLPFLCMAYRSTVHESTGQTPNLMMLGRELPMPSHLLAVPPGQDDVKSPVPFVKELRENMQQMHQVAREKLMKSHRKQKKQYDRGAREKKWEKGMKVWLYNPTKKVERSPKLTIYWEEEPYTIIEIVNDVTMKIRKDISTKPRIVHVDRLKKLREQSLEIEINRNMNRNEELGREEELAEEVQKQGGQLPKTILQEMGLATNSTAEANGKGVIYTKSGRPSKPPVRWSYDNVPMHGMTAGRG